MLAGIARALMDYQELGIATLIGNEAEEELCYIVSVLDGLKCSYMLERCALTNCIIIKDCQ